MLYLLCIQKYTEKSCALHDYVGLLSSPIERKTKVRLSQKLYILIRKNFEFNIEHRKTCMRVPTKSQFYALKLIKVELTTLCAVFREHVLLKSFCFCRIPQPRGKPAGRLPQSVPEGRHVGHTAPGGRVSQTRLGGYQKQH